MTTHHQNPPPNRQTLYDAIALVLGIVVGELLNMTLGSSGMDKPNPALNRIGYVPRTIFKASR